MNQMNTIKVAATVSKVFRFSHVFSFVKILTQPDISTSSSTQRFKDIENKTNFRIIFQFLLILDFVYNSLK